jgi:tetratricopeptide (TPR) repeat protein
VSKSTDQVIAVLFKQVPGGYVFRAPNPKVFGRSPHYLVDEAQRDEIVAIMVPRRPIFLLVAWIAGFVLAVGTAAVSLLLLMPDYPVTVFVVLILAAFLLGILALHLSASRKLRRLQPILARASLTEQQITLAEIQQALNHRFSYRQLLFTAISSAFACAASVATIAVQAYFRKQHVSFLSEPSSLLFGFNAIMFGMLAVTHLRAAREKAKTAQEPTDPASGRNLRKISGRLSTACALVLLAFLVTSAWIGVRHEFSEHNQGLRYEAKGEHDNAILSLSKAILAEPNNVDVYLDRAKSYTAKGDYDHAIADYTRAIEIDAGDAVVHRKRADAYRAKGVLDSAIADYSKAIELDPTDALAYYFRAVSYEGKKSSDRAVADATRAIELNPNDAFAYVLRARNLESTGEHDRATADFNKAIEINPKYYYAYIFRGDALKARGQHDEAVADFTKAIAIDPSNAVAYSNRAASYALTGSNSLAIADYKAIVERPAVTAAERQSQEFARQRIAQLTLMSGTPANASTSAPK